MIGCYSLFQFVANTRRREAVNVGVVLMCQEADFLDYRFLSAEQITSALKYAVGDPVRLAMLAAWQSETAEAWLRRAASTGEIKNRDMLKAFGGRLCNEVSMTEPSGIVLEDPRRELEALFHDLVMRTPHLKRAESGKRIKRHIYDVVQAQGLSDRIHKNYELMLPVVNQQRSFPLMYRNGVTSLVEAVTFKHLGQQKFLNHVLSLKALGQLVEQVGHDEEGKRLRMDLVFDCDDPSGAQTLGEALRNHMRLIPKDHMGTLLEDIAHAEVLP